MKKIILAFDGTHFSEGAFNFARKLNEIQPVFLVGLFVPQTELANLWSYAAAQERFFVPLVEELDADTIKENIDLFENRCKSFNIRYEVHKNFSDLAVPALEAQSRFADLIILGSEIFFEQMGSEQPNEFFEDALHHVKCPVLVVPEKYEFPECNLLAYDGTDNALHAIKTFAYLFPELGSNTAVLAYAHEGDSEIPEKEQLQELLEAHFKNVSMVRYEGKPGNDLNEWIGQSKAPIVVCGSYGRSGFSRLFKKSFVRSIIAEHRMPVFLAHL